MVDGLALIALAGAGLARHLDRYRPTLHGANPWTLEALLNVIRLMPFFDGFERLIEGRTTSIYRSERINKLVGGSPTSEHLIGGAIDRVPIGDVDYAARKAYDAAMRGELGPVHQVIREPSWVHIGWWPPNKNGPPQYLSLVKK